MVPQIRKVRFTVMKFNNSGIAALVLLTGTLVSIPGFSSQGMTVVCTDNSNSDLSWTFKNFDENGQPTIVAFDNADWSGAGQGPDESLQIVEVKANSTRFFNSSSKTYLTLSSDHKSAHSESAEDARISSDYTCSLSHE